MLSGYWARSYPNATALTERGLLGAEASSPPSGIGRPYGLGLPHYHRESARLQHDRRGARDLSGLHESAGGIIGARGGALLGATHRGVTWPAFASDTI